MSQSYSSKVKPLPIRVVDLLGILDDIEVEFENRDTEELIKSNEIKDREDFGRNQVWLVEKNNDNGKLHVVIDNFIYGKNINPLNEEMPKRF